MLSLDFSMISISHKPGELPMISEPPLAAACAGLLASAATRHFGYAPSRRAAYHRSASEVATMPYASWPNFRLLSLGSLFGVAVAAGIGFGCAMPMPRVLAARCCRLRALIMLKPPADGSRRCRREISARQHFVI